MKNYGIRRSAKYRVVESDQLKYYVPLLQFTDVFGVSVSPSDKILDIGSPTARQQPHMQNHPATHTVRSISEHSYSTEYSEIELSLQAAYRNSCLPGMVCDISALPYYDGHLMVHDYGQFDKVFLSYPPCIKAFKHCKPFISVDSMHLYGKYDGVLLIAVAQDGNSNILSVAFAVIEFESTESWSFFLTNLGRHVTPQEGLLIISDRSQVIKAALRANDNLWEPLRVFHAYCVRHMATNIVSRFKIAEGKRYLINAA
ncbi:uncharacterized protein LOC127741602 [Arachis duranensis]|uniref:Uncharacterized protein LOC127741602 n=1 Tax=Arachis duranensis TaxID=130453 RepID=A0A9C6WLI5_ARADU|nr:uncharacterized protein LOC127741602 [Arachis duranensis]